MDIVIPLGKSRNDFLDLRYCLRSIEKYVYGYDEIVIVGEKPSWIQGVVHIPCSDDREPKWKERNILRKFQAACVSKNVSEDFAAWNDDYVILSDIDLKKYPFYYKGTCRGAYDINKGNDYRRTMYHTMTFLENRGFKDYNFDGHCPIVYNKKRFLTTFDNNDVNFNTPFGYGIKTIYACCNGFKPVYMEDVKFQKSISRDEIISRMEGRHVISFNDGPLRTELGQILEEMFPNKSTYEK